MKRIAFAITLSLTLPAIATGGDVLFVTSKSGLFLRKAPDVKSEKIMLVPFGGKVTRVSAKGDTGGMVLIEGRPGQWVRVSCEKKEGFAFDGFLSAILPDPSRPHAGEYIMKTDLKSYMPSKLTINPDGTFRYYINMCQGFGMVSGTYSLQGKSLVLKIEGADFTQGQEDLVEMRMSIEAGGLRLVRVTPAKTIGCDLRTGSYYIRK